MNNKVLAHLLPWLVLIAAEFNFASASFGEIWTETFDSGVGRLDQTSGAGDWRFAWDNSLQAIDGTFYRHPNTDRRYALLDSTYDGFNSVIEISAVITPISGNGQSVRANGFVGLLSSSGTAAQSLIGIAMSHWTENGGGSVFKVGGYYDSGAEVNPSGSPPYISFTFGTTYFVRGRLDGPNSQFEIAVYQGTDATGPSLGTISHSLNPAESITLDAVGLSNYCACSGERTLHARIDNLSVSPDECEGISSISFDLPTGGIDARQPTSLDGSLVYGWQFIDVSFVGAGSDLLPSEFVVTQQGGNGQVPDVLFVIPQDEDTVSLLLSAPIHLAAWTTITHTCSGVSIRLGYLPGDVNGDGTTRPLDILSLIDSLNGVGETRPIWSTDVDRSGQANPADILRLIDLLNGAEAFDVWHGVTLP